MVLPYAMIVNLNQSNSQPQLRFIDMYTYHGATRNYYKHSFFARTLPNLNRLLEEATLSDLLSDF